MTDVETASAATSAAHAMEMDPAYNEGALAFTRGVRFASCPYPAGSAKRNAWESGWFDFSYAVESLPDD
jgi:hypothetical protein